jgi:ribosome-associated heat shock protein Hsp15
MTGDGRQRLDRWLFFARFVKSRTLAARLVAAGGIRVNRVKTTLPSHQVRPGDVLTVTLERRILVVRVLAPGTRRGPAAEARLLYEDVTPPAVPPPVMELETNPAPAGRPTKKERRALVRLRREEG